MKKLFVFVPPKDKTEQELIDRIKECRKEVEEILKEDVKVIFPFIYEETPDSANENVWLTAKCIEKMAFADVVYFDRNFEKDSICSSAFNSAVKNKMPIIIRNDYDNIRTIFYKNKWRGNLYFRQLMDVEDKPKTLVMGAKTINMIVDESGLF